MKYISNIFLFTVVVVVTTNHQATTNMSNKRGTVELVIGPMFSGKTTELLRLLNRHMIREEKCIIIKYLHDNRYSSDCVSSHKGIVSGMAKANFSLDKLEGVWDMIEEDVQVIGIDEGQFFLDLAPFCKEAIKRNKTVIIAALNGKFDLSPWPSVSETIPLAKVTQTSSLCLKEKGCKKKALYSMLLRGNDISKVDVQGKLIGGKDMYISVCSDHHEMIADD
jgi:thymidine kinase